MRCEVVAVGTELLLGQIVDTNSSWIGEQLGLAGINSHFQTKVGDNLERMISVLRIALDRSEAVIMCGGLGPTQDDITREAICAVMDVPLVRHDDIVGHIREIFRRRGRGMPEINARQADVPEGARVIAQMPGTAPGLVCPVGEKVIYAVPGVPYEMRTMISGTVIPDLQRRTGTTSAIRSRTLRTWGWSESRLAETLADRIHALDESGNPTIAFLASGVEGMKVRITAKSSDPEAAEAILAREEERLRALIGEVVFSVDDENMESTVIGLLRERGLTLAVAESLTGGLVGARLTAVPGAGEVLRGAIVSDARDIKTRFLGITDTAAEPADVVKAMATGVREALGADVGLATLGVDGSVSREGRRRGTVYLGVALGEDVGAERVRLPGDGEQIRQFAVISLLNLLRLRVLGRRG